MGLARGRAVLYSDGGGKRAAALNPIRGANLRFFAGVGPQRPDARRHGGAARHSQRAPGFVLRESDGSIDTMAVEHRAGRIVAIYLIRNPDKLQHVWFERISRRWKKKSP
jgi:RNA polymerase sigma-70 factor, ECF subfamily